MDGTPGAGANTGQDATLLTPRDRSAFFVALRPALDALATEAGTDGRLPDWLKEQQGHRAGGSH